MPKSKLAYYFSHDYNAATDDRMVAIIMNLGLEGYGIYWRVIETLAQATGYKYPMKALDRMAFTLNITEELLRKFIDLGLKVELFVDENGYLVSKSLSRRLKMRDQLLKDRKEAGKRGGKNKPNNPEDKRDSDKNKEEAKDKQSPSKGKTKGKQGKEVKEVNELKETKEMVRADFDTPQAWIAYSMKSIYETQTGQVYKIKTPQDYVTLNRLINMADSTDREKGEAIVIEKAKMFLDFCIEGKVWFATGGMSDFTIGNFSNKWNQILEEAGREKDNGIDQDEIDEFING